MPRALPLGRDLITAATSSSATLGIGRSSNIWFVVAVAPAVSYPARPRLSGARVT